MFNINDQSIIYVACPYFNKTGGTELVHQLVYSINHFCGKAIVAYYGSESAPNKVNPAFREYVSTFVDIKDVIDSLDNIIILPEINPDLAANLESIQKAVWWMSVDNYLKRNGILGSLEHFGLLRTIKLFVKGNIKIGGYRIDKEIPHLYQSEYAKQFLLAKGVKKYYRLSDYLNESYIQRSISTDTKKDVILYNPKKGIEFTRELIKQAPELTFSPIENMSTEQVKKLLSKSKVYIDFGNHPGKDRFPREAAISGCCVITGKRGSAKYYKDIPIPDSYKFEDTVENIPNIIETLKSCLKNYDKHTVDFEKYQQYIKSEHDLFERDVKELFTRNRG
ncbi:TPA: hypothetical protein V1D49_000760 [Streptococcus pneumoniae]|nr:hypothetical protein [Streptococcus pneumoniae]